MEVQLGGWPVVSLFRFVVKATGGESLDAADVGPHGLVGDREWAVYAEDGKLATGKHSRRFRRMDPVFELVAHGQGTDARIVLPDGSQLAAGEQECDRTLTAHFGQPVTLRRATGVPHFDAAPVSVVGTATLVELGRHEGDGRPLDPRHLRANVVIQTEQPYAEEGLIGHEVAVGAVRLRVVETIERCRMVGVAQVGLPARPRMLQAVSDHHALQAGVYAEVLGSGVVRVGDVLQVSRP